MKSDMKISPLNNTNSTETAVAVPAHSFTIVAPSSTVRVNNLANFEQAAYLISNGTEIVGIAISILLFVNLIKGKWTLRRRLFKASTALLILLFSVNLPGTVNWLIASARDSSCGDFM